MKISQEERARRMGLFHKAYKNTSGNITMSCAVAEISRRTYYDWMINYPHFKEEVEAQDETLLDRAESRLQNFMNMEKSDPHLAYKATMFYLNNKGKTRGYGYKQINLNTKGDDSLENVSNLELVSTLKSFLNELDIDENENG